MPDLTDRIARLIAVHGPIPVAQFMAEANAAYYADADPLGADGDFITAPEISQMFGELIGLWFADLWLRAGKPPSAYVELGPGRGTLTGDALRSMLRFGLDPPVHYVETSPALRDKQRKALPGAHWHDDVSTLPEGPALLVVANEFFDALPVRQFVRTIAGWRERLVGFSGGEFVRTPGQEPFDAVVPPRLRAAEPGSVIEASPACAAVMGEIAWRIARVGGAALVIDYGYVEHAQGDTLQAVHAHAYADPMAKPGASDLTAHVDFGALTLAAEEAGARVFGPVDQGAWLEALGIRARAAALVRAAPERAEEIETACARLVDENQMGTLFKLIAAIGGEWPDPDGFADALSDPAQ